MLVQGNAKLGRTIWQFSIPAGKTCPGKSKVCNERCYAQAGLFKMASVVASHQRNLEASKNAHFVANMVDFIQRKKIKRVRIHVAGDLYSPEYAKKWYDIISQCSDTRFFLYTRSWRIAEFKPVLKKLATLSNLRLWFSVDTETETPTFRPKGVRFAYMSIEDNDEPPEVADLVFRDYPIRKKVQKYINGVLVCPPENGLNKLGCEKCGICWSRSETPKQESRRLSLQTV